MKKVLLTLLVGMFLISMTSAQSIYQQSSELDLKVPCFYNDTRCSDTAKCNLSILYPNSSFLVEEQPMTNLLNGYHNYTLNESQTSVLGEYSVSIYCIDNGETGYSTFAFDITPTGHTITTGQTVISIGLILVTMILAVFFGWLGFKFVEKERLAIEGMVFLITSLFLSTIPLMLAYLFSRDILFNLAATEIMFRLWYAMFWILFALVTLRMLVFLIQVMKQVLRAREQKRHGEGYNMKTKQYE